MGKKVLVTGGHLTPALAVMRVLRDRGWEVVYVGRSQALEGETTPAQEMSEVKRLGYSFISIQTGRLQRLLTFQTIISLLKIGIGIFQGLKIVFNNKPQAVLSFGGYVAVPIVFWSWIFRIPIVTHEQTLSPGLANRLISSFATKICVGFSEVMDAFPSSKTIYTGNPVRAEIFQTKKDLKVPKGRPIVYITGGNLGSHSINTLVEDILEVLLDRFTIIHQCGNSQRFQDFERLSRKRVTLSEDRARYYLLFSYVESDKVGDILHQADVLVTRAGANIVSEIISLAKPALFIPLPWSAAQEQKKNADYLVQRGAALSVAQQGLTSEKLLNEIEHLVQEKKRLTNNLQILQKNRITDADKRVSDVLESVA